MNGLKLTNHLIWPYFSPKFYHVVSQLVSFDIILKSYHLGPWLFVLLMLQYSCLFVIFYVVCSAGLLHLLTFQILFCIFFKPTVNYMFLLCIIILKCVSNFLKEVWLKSILCIIHIIAGPKTIINPCITCYKGYWTHSVVCLVAIVVAICVINGNT